MLAMARPPMQVGSRFMTDAVLRHRLHSLAKVAVICVLGVGALHMCPVWLLGLAKPIFCREVAAAHSSNGAYVASIYSCSSGAATAGVWTNVRLESTPILLDFGRSHSVAYYDDFARSPRLWWTSNGELVVECNCGPPNWTASSWGAVQLMIR
jgi:hypothetical protein